MSDDAHQLSTRERTNEALSQIVGLPLTAARRAADMRTLQFGSLRPGGGGSVGDFALHIQCPWRIDGPDGIVTGRLDLWRPVEDDAKIDYETWDYDESPNLQDFRLDRLLARDGLTLIVESVDTDEFGVIVFKRIGETEYAAPDNWKIEPGAVLEEVVNPDRCSECACGVNFGTHKWCDSNYTGADLWRCRIAWLDLASAVIPYHTDGKARCGRLTLLEKVEVA